VTGPPGIMDISDIVAALPLAPSETLAVLKDLFAHGLIDMNTRPALFSPRRGILLRSGRGKIRKRSLRLSGKWWAQPILQDHF